jgi:uncharacterized protein (DUF1810 family)
MNDPFHLERFVEAQNHVFDDVRLELRSGRKHGHWMWFVFPQLSGLGSSWMAQTYAIASRAEAEAYMAHPLLAARLLECTQLVNQVEGKTAEEIFGAVDTLKFRSSLTLFHAISGHPVFQSALRKYFAGQPDQRTLDLFSH